MVCRHEVIILRVAIPSPIRRCFDYLPPIEGNNTRLKPGIRIRVPFGKRKACIGFLISIENQSEFPHDKLKRAIEVLDTEPLVKTSHLALLKWASRYYQHPIGEVFFNAFPTPIRQGKKCEYPSKTIISINRKQNGTQLLNRAPKQKELYDRLNQENDVIELEQLKQWPEFTIAGLKSLLDKKLLTKKNVGIKPTETTNGNINLLESTKAQKEVIQSILKGSTAFNCFLLNGITGSGKTQVYMEIIAGIIQQGKQALLLLPEIGLTPQFIQGFNHAFATKVGLYHSGLSDQERLNNWLMARDGSVQIIIGTRSAIWLPLRNPGLIIVDEEHDLSYKQQDGFRYSARDIAVIRAQKEKIPVILGSATPSMESLNNCNRGIYQELRLTKRIGKVKLPETHLIDLRVEPMTGALSHTLISHMQEVIANKQQVLLFINRRGFAPAILCHSCGHVVHCNRCDKPMTYHKRRNKLCCHHCDRQIAALSQCPMCESVELIEVGHGTERIEEDIRNYFPKQTIIRIDRDSIRSKGKLDEYLTSIKSGDADIMIGTQMLAKGHDFPKLTLVGIIDVDGGLYSTDFRASERMAQLLTQVSGRAGRAIDSGKVLIQTHHPEHPLLNTLIKQGYESFSKLLLEDRQLTQLPPFSYFALLRAEAHEQSAVKLFLDQAKNQLSPYQTRLQIYGPIQAPFQRKAGRYRMQLLIQTEKRKLLAKYLTPWLQELEQLKTARKVRWNLDIDPQDML